MNQRHALPGFTSTPCRTETPVSPAAGAAAPECRTDRRLILDQRNECGPVRIVFDRSTVADASLATLEIDHAVGALVTATATLRVRHAAGIVAAALGQAFGQRLDRLALPQAGTVNDHQLALARRVGLNVFSAIFLFPFGFVP
jgi:hypothetical protein